MVAGALSFEDGLRLVSKRAMAMQKACEAVPGTMAAILGLDDAKVEEACASIDGVVVAANYKLPRPTGYLGQRRSGRCRLPNSRKRAPNAHCVCP